MRRIGSACCACAASGHAAAEPAITLMKSRRLIASPEAQDRASYRPNPAHRKGGRYALDPATRCPLWVKSRHVQRKS